MAQRKSKKESPEERVDDAIRVSGGTVPMTLVFETDEEAQAARKHMKGKKKAKVLDVTTVAERNRRMAELRKQWAEQDHARAAGQNQKTDDGETPKKKRTRKKKAA